MRQTCNFMDEEAAMEMNATTAQLCASLQAFRLISTRASPESTPTPFVSTLRKCNNTMEEMLPQRKRTARTNGPKTLARLISAGRADGKKLGKYSNGARVRPASISVRRPPNSSKLAKLGRNRSKDGRGRP